jgi:hypothetical protein
LIYIFTKILRKVLQLKLFNWICLI